MATPSIAAEIFAVSIIMSPPAYVQENDMASLNRI
jgi:hypothetical protein